MILSEMLSSVRSDIDLWEIAQLFIMRINEVEFYCIGDKRQQTLVAYKAFCRYWMNISLNLKLRKKALRRYCSDHDSTLFFFEAMLCVAKNDNSESALKCSCGHPK